MASSICFTFFFRSKSKTVFLWVMTLRCSTFQKNFFFRQKQIFFLLQAFPCLFVIQIYLTWGGSKNDGAFLLFSRLAINFLIHSLHFFLSLSLSLSVLYRSQSVTDHAMMVFFQFFHISYECFGSFQSCDIISFVIGKSYLVRIFNIVTFFNFRFFEKYILLSHVIDSKMYLFFICLCGSDCIDFSVFASVFLSMSSRRPLNRYGL